MKRIFLLLGLLAFISCNKSSEPPADQHLHNATIKANVYRQQLNSNNVLVQTPVSGATVQLFETTDDRQLNVNVIISRTTDSTGLAQFSNLEKEYYYIKCDHNVYGELLDETSTPDGTVSFVEFDY